MTPTMYFWILQTNKLNRHLHKIELKWIIFNEFYKTCMTCMVIKYQRRTKPKILKFIVITTIHKKKST